MSIFSRIDKKVLMILVLTIIVVALFCLAVFKYLANSNIEVKNSAGGAQIEQQEQTNNTPEVEIEASGVEVQGQQGTGSLIICADKCGDLVCQTADTSCEQGSLNCPCPETNQDCPQDCK